MNHAPAILTITAASALLLVAWRRSVTLASYSGADDLTPDWSDEVSAAVSTVGNAFAPAASMVPSDALRAMLKRRERLSLTPYWLGDGGATIGYGRFYRAGGPQPPASITRETAEAWFEQDLEERGARWVRAYVTVPLSQPRFDALVHMAFNLSPKSFKTIADAVNRGEDPEAAALQFIRAGTNLERGLRNRRAEEMALYRHGVYA